MSNRPGYAIIGCGLIGKKRATAMESGQLQVVYDPDRARAAALVALIGSGRVANSVEDAVRDPAVDGVLVCTINVALAPSACTAVEAGKAVLVEKPAGISRAEVEKLAALARERGVIVRTGFNHRYHPALLQAREIERSGVLGPLMFVRGRYGHGGRVGYDREWRADPKLSGGGELVDQGVHLIDLAGWFLGDFTTVQGHVTTSYWDMPVEDNAFLSLRTTGGQTAWLHASCSEWKNLFSFEIYGRNGKLHIEGLGGSYGVERLTYYAMKPEMGPPETTAWDYPGPDLSWRRELESFAGEIETGRATGPGLAETLAVWRVVEEIYAQSGKENCAASRSPLEKSK